MLKSSTIALFLVAGLVCAQSEPSKESWENLGQLRAGEAIEVVDAQMKSHTGGFVRHTQEEISLRKEGSDFSIPRAHVASVKRSPESHRRRNVLLGLAVGAASGFAVGAIRGATYHEAGETPVFVAVWTPIGAGIGAAAGVAWPSGREVTVYRARLVKSGTNGAPPPREAAPALR